MRLIAQHHETVNVASGAILRKCGFTHVDTYMHEWPPHRGGGWREIKRWRLDLTEQGQEGKTA